MTEFIRARSNEQKAQRLEEIKNVAKAQFATHPYHEITLTTIASDLGWSRANLYKYVTTKEEIFLALVSDSYNAYIDALMAALPRECGFTTEIIAEIWAGIANAHRDYFQYGNILYTIIETNVSVDRLAEFKRNFYDGTIRLFDQIEPLLGIKKEYLEQMFIVIYHQGVGLAGNCLNNPLVQQALSKINIERKPIDFKAEMREIILMTLSWCQKKQAPKTLLSPPQQY